MGRAVLPALAGAANAVRPALSARVAVHVVPRAAATAVAGRHGDAIRIRVAAPPADGAANEELVRFIAAVVGVPRRAVSVVAGHSGRRKIIDIEGIDGATALRRLTAGL